MLLVDLKVENSAENWCNHFKDFSSGAKASFSHMSFVWRVVFFLSGGCLWCVRELYAINKYQINQKSFSFKLFNCVRESYVL